MNLEDRLLAAGLVPDVLLRRVVRARVHDLAASLDLLNPQERAERETTLIAQLESGPLAVNADDANRQHYDLPPEFFTAVLGPRLKYSCCYWPDTMTSLAQAEEAMLELTARRADLRDGLSLLDLGCGWGSLALWAAERYPGSRVVAMSNSNTQRRFIEDERLRRELHNLEVVTAEVGGFEPKERFDRVVSIEMFEHVRNHRLLLEHVAEWLKPEGRLFVHIFCHRDTLYTFEQDSTGGWMARHFFSGGIMPSWDYLPRYQTGLILHDRWQVDGRHYSRTLRAWLNNLHRRHRMLMPILQTVYGRRQSRLWFHYWRIFFMACDETFALDDGQTYFVGHYLFSKRT